jgi:mannose-6-phosphate isomerase-like protein (cupin superfamily)
MTRRIVTEEAEGRSRIASDSPAPVLAMSADGGVTELWINLRDEALGHDPTIEDAALTPPPGSLHWRIFDLPPEAGTQGARDDSVVQMDEVDDEGWHCTPTLDYIYVLEGDITLELDEGSVDLSGGDCVVQRRTNHRWRNRGSTKARVMAIMLGVDS